MKAILIIILSISLIGCASNLCVQKSEYVITTFNESIVYIKDGDVGQQLYRYWKQGEWDKECIVVLLDTVQFKKLYEKSYISKRGDKRR